MRTMRTMFSAVVTAGLVAACVTQGTYDELQAEFDDYKDQADARDEVNNTTITDLQGALNEAKAKSRELSERVATLEAEIATATEALAAKDEELEALRGDKASLVKDRTRLQASKAEMEEALNELARRKAESDKRVAEYTDLLARFKSLIDAGKLTVRIIDGQMVVQLATDILFPSGRAELSSDGKQAIVEVTGILTSIPERRFQVAGHTDNVPIRTSKYPSNWELAFDRAMSVVRTMTEAGMSEERVSAASYAEYKPAASNASSEGKAKNRRIEIIVVPDLSTLPGADELERLDQGDES